MPVVAGGGFDLVDGTSARSPYIIECRFAAPVLEVAQGINPTPLKRDRRPDGGSDVKQSLGFETVARMLECLSTQLVRGGLSVLERTIPCSRFRRDTAGRVVHAPQLMFPTTHSVGP